VTDAVTLRCAGRGEESDLHFVAGELESLLPAINPYGAGAAGAAPRVLSQAAQNDVPAKLAAWRAARNLDRSASVDDARAADPAGWAVLEADMVAIVIGMPLAKLQRFGEGRRSVDRFIYDFSWPDEVSRAAVARPGFDDALRLRPGVGEWLVRLTPLTARPRWLYARPSAGGGPAGRSVSSQTCWSLSRLSGAGVAANSPGSLAVVIA
jgi:hypothetical protein